MLQPSFCKTPYPLVGFVFRMFLSNFMLDDIPRGPKYAQKGPQEVEAKKHIGFQCVLH